MTYGKVKWHPVLIKIERPNGEQVPTRWPIDALLELFDPQEDELKAMNYDQRLAVLKERYNLND